jgi:hypothetical protein
MIQIGQIVQIRSGLNHRVVGGGVVVSISPKGQRVVLKEPGRSNIRSFYRNGQAGTTYINDPGTGQWGHMLNDRFSV